MGTSTNGSESSADTATYPYKNEVSLSIGDDTSTIAAPTPSPRHMSAMEDVPLTKNSPDVEMRNASSGFDNPAFDKRPLSSFGQNEKSATDGGSPDKNGKEKPVGECELNSTDSTDTLIEYARSSVYPSEAVNLELVNMNGNGTKNGMSSPKKETEVHHIGDPYDEYFVPVNEHRKYMR